MANTKISALTGATTPLAGTEVIPIVQSGATKNVSVANLTAGRAVSALSLAVTNGGSFNTNTLFIDSTANAVGFGTSTPFSTASFGANIGKTFAVYEGSGGANKYGIGMGGAGTGGDPYRTKLFANGTEYQSIGTTGVVTMAGYGAGAATFSAAGVISSVSDETWKIKDGVPVDPDSMLKKLEPGYWYYNEEKKELFGAERQLGFYAQNVNAAIGPEAAPEPSSYTNIDSDGNEITTTRPWGYYDRSVLAVTVMSLQKALATIETLTARIEALEAKIPA